MECMHPRRTSNSPSIICLRTNRWSLIPKSEKRWPLIKRILNMGNDNHVHRNTRFWLGAPCLITSEIMCSPSQRQFSHSLWEILDFVRIQHKKTSLRSGRFWGDSPLTPGRERDSSSLIERKKESTRQSKHTVVVPISCVTIKSAQCVSMEHFTWSFLVEFRSRARSLIIGFLSC